MPPRLPRSRIDSSGRQAGERSSTACRGGLASRRAGLGCSSQCSRASRSLASRFDGVSARNHRLTHRSSRRHLGLPPGPRAGRRATRHRVRNRSVLRIAMRVSGHLAAPGRRGAQRPRGSCVAIGRARKPSNVPIEVAAIFTSSLLPRRRVERLATAIDEAFLAFEWCLVRFSGPANDSDSSSSASCPC
jgi:hypothetical protein